MGEMSNKALAYARKQVGCAYSQDKRWNEAPPIFDCSSLCYRAYRAAGHTWTCAGTRSNELVYDKGFDLLFPAKAADIGQKLPSASTLLPGLKLKAGDLIFLNTDKTTTRKNKITHVAMAIDATRIVHARGTNYGVREDAASIYATKVCAVLRLREGDAPIPPTPPTPPTPEQPPLLKQGSKGIWVSKLQTLLNAQGNTLVVDGDFGTKTFASVKEFQKVKKLTVDGIVGPKTWEALSEKPPLLKQGDKGTWVSQLQMLLNAQGNTLVVDSDFGAKTLTAVKAFQKAKKLTADGIVGPLTWAALSVK